MNLLLLDAPDFLAPDRAMIRDPRRLEALLRVRGLTPGDTLAAGRLDGPMGEARVRRIEREGVELDLDLHRPPPAPLPLTLVLALPRPQQIKRILQTVAGTGIKELHLIHSRRVEKSYWQSPSLDDSAIRQQLLLGLEQGCDTRLPRVHWHRRFKPFVEDVLPTLTQQRLALLAHPYHARPCPHRIDKPVLLVLGPEGGFNDFEVDLLRSKGLETVHLGERILKTETALPFLLGRLF